MRHGHQCVAFDQNPSAVQALQGSGIGGSTDLADLVRRLSAPRVVWVMLPPGDVTEQAVTQLGNLLQSGDIIVDGGNSYYKDDVRRAGELAGKGIHYLDAGIIAALGSVIVLLGTGWPASLAWFRALELGMTALFASRIAIVQYRLCSSSPCATTRRWRCWS